MIQVDNLRFRTLSIDRLRIPPGSTAVIGPNGSGKTSFLKLLAGIHLPESGTITIDGRLPRETEAGWVGEFPDRNILFCRAFDEVASPLRFRFLPCREIGGRVQSVMERAGISHLMSRPIRQLSGGEKMLIACAAALVIRPEILVLDEYDSHLDADRISQIGDIIRKSGVHYTLHCTQDTESAACADHVVFFGNGREYCSGSPETVFARLEGTPYFPLSWRCRA